MDSGGSATLELVVLAPVVLLLLGLVIVTGRLGATTAAIENAAAEGARYASIARTAAMAQGATEVVAASLRRQDIACQGLRVAVDTAGFARPVGRPASVTIEVSCDVRMSDQAVPGLPGTRRLQARASSVLDSYRGR